MKCNRLIKGGMNKTINVFLNTVINRQPFKTHVPGYQFYGPDTKLE